MFRIFRNSIFQLDKEAIDWESNIFFPENYLGKQKSLVSNTLSLLWFHITLTKIQTFKWLLKCSTQLTIGVPENNTNFWRQLTNIRKIQVYSKSTLDIIAAPQCDILSTYVVPKPYIENKLKYEALYSAIKLAEHNTCSSLLPRPTNKHSNMDWCSECKLLH